MKACCSEIKTLGFRDKMIAKLQSVLTQQPAQMHRQQSLPTQLSAARQPTVGSTDNAIKVSWDVLNSLIGFEVFETINVSE